MSDPKDTVAPAEVIEAAKEAAKVEPKAKADDAEPHWLPARLERERASMLKKLGFESVEDAQATSTELKAKREAEKTSAEKAADAVARAKKAESKEKALSEAVTSFATQQLTALTEEQKAAVMTAAGDDAALQLKMIAALAPTWAKATAPAKVEAPKAVDTAPPANAPSQTSTSDTNHKAQYESLKKTNPFAAAAYGLAHSGEVFGNGT